MYIKRTYNFSAVIFFILLLGLSPGFAKDEKIIQEEKIFSQLFASKEKNLVASKYIEENKPLYIMNKLASLVLSGKKASDTMISIQALKLYPKDKILDTWVELLLKIEPADIKKIIISYLADLHDRRLVVPYAKLLKDPFQKIRTMAALALKKNGDDRMYPYILTMADHKDPAYRIYALEALFYLYDKRFYSVVIKHFKDPNKSVRIYALECVKKNKLLEAMYLVRDAALNDKNDEVKINAVELIGHFCDHGSLYVLFKTISSADRDLRYATARSLYEINSRNSLYVLSSQLANEDDHDIKCMIIKTFLNLKGVGDPKGVGTVLKSDKDPKLRIKSAYLLGIINDTRAIPYLESALSDNNYKVRAEACNSLGNYKYGNVLKSLVNIIISDKKRYVRSAALYSLKKINNSNVTLPLFTIYTNEKDIVFKQMMQNVIQWFNKKSFNF